MKSKGNVSNGAAGDPGRDLLQFRPFVLCLFLAAQIASASAAESGLVDVSDRPHAKVRPLGLGEARWTSGFWAKRFNLARTKTIPSLERLLGGTNYSHYLRNFEIAAGLAEGRYRGAPFNDGDFYKWMEAAIASLAVEENPDLEARLEEIISVIAKAQRPDGYIHTRVLVRQRNGDPEAAPFQDRHNFEMYNMGHLLTTASVHHRVTGRTHLLSVARTAADFLDNTFQGASPEAARSSVCPSHYMGIIDLYRQTGEPRYLDLAKQFFEMRSQITDGGDDNQDRIPLDRQTNAVGHAVRANYLYAGAADLFMETGDETLRRPLEPIWRNLVERKMYITGGCGALYDGASPYGSRDQGSITRTHQAYGHSYELPNTTAHAETCANIGNVLWNRRMFLVTGEARFIDVAELALYNSVLSGVSLDGTNFFYTNPLRVTDPLPADLRWSRTRVPFVSAFCCPPNLARTIAESSNYAYAKSPGALWVNLYGASTLATTLPDGQPVKVTQETEYPWSGRVRIRIDECGTEAFALKMRIPGWAEGGSLRINQGPRRNVVAGQTNAVPSNGWRVADGYVEMNREWTPGDMVDLDLPMPARLIEANPLVEETRNQVAVKRGPIVYCLESVDLPDTVDLMDVMIPADVALRARYDGRLLDGVVVIEGRAEARTPGNWSGRLYRELEPLQSQPFNLRLVPYYAWNNRGASEMTVWMPLSPR